MVPNSHLKTGYDLFDIIGYQQKIVGLNITQYHWGLALNDYLSQIFVNFNKVEKRIQHKVEEMSNIVQT